MVYDKKRVENNWQRSNQSKPKSLNEQGSRKLQQLIPINEEENQKWLADRKAQREQKYVDSLTVFQLDNSETKRTSDESQQGHNVSLLKEDTDNKDKKKPKNQRQEKVNKKKQQQKQSKEEEEEEKKKKKQKSWLPILDRRTKPQQQKNTKPNQNQTKNAQAEGKIENQQQAQNQDSQSNSTEKTDNQSTKATKPQTNSQNNNSDNSSKESNTNSRPAKLKPIPVEPIFIAPNLSIANQPKAEDVIGKTDDGSIIYISKNPGQDRAAVESGMGERELPTSQTNSIYDQQQQQAQTALDSVKEKGNTAGENIGRSSTDSLAQLSVAIATAQSTTEGAIASQKEAVTAMMSNSRNTVQAQTAQTVAQIEGHYTTTIQGIDAKTTAAIQQLTANYQRINQELSATHANFTERVTNILQTTHTAFTQQHQKAQTSLLNTKQIYLNQYSKESPRKSDNPVVRALDNLGWDAYVTNWRQAKTQATEKVAQSYLQSENELFSNNLASLEKYRTTILEGGKQLLSKNQQALLTSYQQKQSGLTQQGAAAKASATTTKQQLVTSINQSQAQQLEQINATETGLIQSISEKGGESLKYIQEFGQDLRGNVESAIARGEESFNQAVQGFSEGLNLGQDFRSLAGANTAADSAKAEIDAAYAQTQTEINTATNSAVEQIQKFSAEINQSLSGIAQSASGQQQEQLSSYNTQLQKQSLNARSLFNQQLTSYSQSSNAQVAASVQQWQNISQSLSSGYQTVTRNLQQQLDTAQNQVAMQQTSLLTKMGKDIRTQADAEAEKVQPGWKKVVKIIVNVVITVAVTVAIAALALSGVGIVALIGLGALIGAAGGLAKLAANDLIDGKRSSLQEYLKAGAVGAVTGVLEALGGRAIAGLGGKLGAQILTKVEHIVASTGIETVTNTLVEMTESLAQGEDFTLKLLGISVASSLLSAAGGKYIDVKFSDIASSAAKGTNRELGETAAEGVVGQATSKGLSREISQFATETSFEAAVNTGASVARGEELTLEKMGENLASSVLGRGAAGRVDKLYGNRLRNLGSPSSPTGNSSPGAMPNRSGQENKQTGDYPSGTLRDRTPTSEASTTPINSLQRNSEFETVANSNLSSKVEVYSDPNLPGRTVKAEYDLADDGTVRQVRMRAGVDATVDDIRLHQHTVKVMQMYGGTLGKVRVVEAKIAKWLGIKEQSRIGSKAWEAQHEIPKLRGIIQERMIELQNADPDQVGRLEADIENLTDQLNEHRRTFEAQDESDGVGYIAAKGKYTPEQIQQITSNLKVGDEVKRADGRGQITKIDNGNVTIKLTMTRGRGKGSTMTVTTPISQYGNGWELVNSTGKRTRSTPVSTNEPAVQPEPETKKARLDEQATITNRTSRTDILSEYDVSPQNIREITNQITDDLLKDKDVEIAASQFNRDGRGTKDNPNRIGGAIDVIGNVRHQRDTKQNLPEGESRTRHYQFGEQENTRVSEDIKNYPNAFVRGGGSYDPHVLKTFEDMKNNANLDDQDIAAAMNELVRKGKIPPGMLNRQQEKKLTEITYLIFGRESVRNKRNLVQASILFSQVTKNRISLENAITQLPMSPDGAQKSAQRLDDFDSGIKSYPQEGTKIYEQVKEVEQKETDVINDFIADEMKKDGIEQFNTQQELIEYIEGKIRKNISLFYGINKKNNQ